MGTVEDIQRPFLVSDGRRGMITPVAWLVTTSLTRLGLSLYLLLSAIALKYYENIYLVKIIVKFRV